MNTYDRAMPDRYDAAFYDDIDEMSLTSAAAIAISLIVSFTLTPTLAARWIKPVEHDPSHAGDEEADASRRGFYRHIDRAYTALLHWSMAHRWLIVTTSVLVVLSIVPLFRASGLNFTPVEDESRFQISVRLPVGSSIAATRSSVGSVATFSRICRACLPYRAMPGSPAADRVATTAAASSCG